MIEQKNSKKFPAPRTKEIFSDKLFQSKLNTNKDNDNLEIYQSKKISETVQNPEIKKSRTAKPKVLMGGHPFDFIPNSINERKKPISSEKFISESPQNKKHAKDEKRENRHS